MKAMLGKGGIKNSQSKKNQSISSEAASKVKDEKNTQMEKFDRNNISEADLDRIMAFSLI